MITASFTVQNGKYVGFCVKGHSGYSREGSDIVCAAVSSMVMLTVNNITDSFGIKGDLVSDESVPVIKFSLAGDDERGILLIEGLWRELSALAQSYPKFLRVTH